MWIHANQIRRHLGGWVICQSPYHWPDGLRRVIERTVSEFNPDKFGMIKFDIEKHKLRDFLRDVLWKQPQVILWNRPKACSGWKRFFRKAPSFIAVSRYGAPPPDHDIIDIDALARNVAASIIAEWVKDGNPTPPPDTEDATKLTH